MLLQATLAENLVKKFKAAHESPLKSWERASRYKIKEGAFRRARINLKRRKFSSLLAFNSQCSGCGNLPRISEDGISAYEPIMDYGPV